jgi:ABC-2 type transport system permease protein
VSGRRSRFWSNLLAVAYKEALVIRHDQAFFAAIVAQPAMMTLLFGYAITFQPKNVPWAVLDRSATTASRRLTEEIAVTGYFLPPQTVHSYQEARDILRGERALAVLVVPETFARDLVRGHPRVQLLLDGSDPLTVARIGAYVGQVAAVFSPRADAPARGVPARSPPGGIDVRQRFWFNPTLLDRVFFLAALAGMVLTNFCLSATSLGIVGERESGTYEQMLASPTTPIELVLGKLLPNAVVAFGVFVLVNLIAGLLFGLWPHGSLLALVLVTLPFIVASLAIGVLVSTLAHTSAQAVFVSVFFILPSFVLSGVMYPYQFMPNGIRQIGALMPLRWYQIASRRIIERGAGIVDVAGPLLALLVIFGVLLALIRWRLRPRLG